MDNIIKISLTIIIEGSTLVRKSEPINLGKKNRKHYPLETKDAIYHINLTKEAYDYMVSEESPAWARAKFLKWKKLKPEERLELHMRRISNSYKGKSYKYSILED